MCMCICKYLFNFVCSLVELVESLGGGGRGKGAVLWMCGCLCQAGAMLL